LAVWKTLEHNYSDITNITVCFYLNCTSHIVQYLRNSWYERRHNSSWKKGLNTIRRYSTPFCNLHIVPGSVLLKVRLVV
jgi:hypothetical protein